MVVRKQTLRWFRFLRRLNDAELARLARHVAQTHHPAQAILFPDQQIGDTFYLLKSGRVEIFKKTEHGDVILNVIQPGHYFGEMSLLDNRPRSAAARAATDVTVLQVPKAEFLTLVQRFPFLLSQTAHVSDERLRQRDQSLIAELTTHNQQLQQLYETSLDISRHRELDDALAAISARATTLSNSSAGKLYLFDETTRHLRTSNGERIRIGTGAAGRAFAARDPVMQNRAKPQRVLAVPICLDAKSLGALVVYRPSRAKPFTPDDARLLLLFANQAAIAIENARLFALAAEKARLDTELQTARQVQRSLLPTRAPRIPGFQLAGLWRPAREVAGDFYDFIPLDNGRWGIVIADVCDKGMPAALFMATARSVVRASARAALTTVAALEHANRIIAADATNGMFVTLFLGILDPRARRFEYVNAGHNPPLWLRAASARLEYLRRTALPLGIDANSRFESREITLAPRDTLVLYTDGVTDAVNAREQSFGAGRLTRLAKANARADAATVVRALNRAIRAFIATQPLGDDVTMVVLRALGI
jgi:serine phosphatase RsbU (regulator of sigma subunit)/CRP-like cAMP-binding protein